MKFIYLTSKKYPATTADHLFVLYMAKAFTEILGKDFSLCVRGEAGSDLDGVYTVSVPAPAHLRSVFYFFWLPFFVIKNNQTSKKTVFFSNDPYLLKTLIFWKKLFGFGYVICSDWHQLFQDSRDKYIATGSDFLISTSEKLKGLIVSLGGINPNKVLVAYGGVGTEAVSNHSKSVSDLRKDLGLPQDDFLVGYVGFYKTMGMEKGVGTMIEALAQISDKKIKMAFVGGRNKEIEEYSILASRLGILERIVFVPAVPYASVAAYEQAFDLLTIPYPNEPHFANWGFPMKVYEYMASGRPILYSDLPIIGEMLSDCAVSFKAGNSKDLAEKIMMVVNNPDTGKDLSDKALQKVQNFTWQKRAQKIIDFIT